MLIKKKNTQRVRKPKSRSYNQKPLTFYRSGSSGSEPVKPVKNNSAGKKTSKSFARLITIFLALILILGFIYNLTLQPEPVVSTSDSSYRDLKEYEAAAAEKFQTIKNRNKITIDDTEIKNQLSKSFPEIIGMSMEQPLVGRRIKLHLFVAKPVLLLETASGTHIISARGSSVGNVADFPHLNKLPVLKDESGFSIEGNKQVLTEDTVKFITVIKSQLEGNNLKINSMALPPLPHELHVKLEGLNYIIKLQLQKDALQQAGQILGAHSRFKSSGELPKEYLDVRVPGKVFFK